MKSNLYNILFLAWIGLLFTNLLFAQQDTSCVGQQGKITWLVYDNIVDNDLEDLYVDPSYPLSPTYQLDLSALQSTYNFNNNYGSIIKGFIKVPVNGNYIFNVTGNDIARFFLSEDTNPANLFMASTTLGATGNDEHDRWPEQTSPTYTLVAGQYHYFEVHHKESMYSDHATVYWKSPLFADTLWRVVNATHLYEYACDSLCPTAGTPCDDGIAATTNDMADGFCNCVGEYTSNNNCVGHRGDVLAMFYNNIPGSSLSNLYAAPNYPLQPDSAIEMSQLNMPYNFADEYGTVVKGYFRVPQSGVYKFNVTGDDDTRFYLSSDHNINNLILRCEVDGWTGRTEHYKYPEQTSTNISLNKNFFYYFEIHHKEGGGGDHSNLYWKTPFRPDTNWMVVQGLYLYGYDCEMACVPQGTACNDHDTDTENDQYDANCDCVGTPCEGPCNPGNQIVTTATCDLREEYSNNAMDSWLSCVETVNPNTLRGNGHWIMYDFGESLKIERNRYWNYNVAGQTGKGAKTVIIDYADQTNVWTNLGTYQWAQATGQNGYVGDSIIDLNGIRARYLLLTISEAWTSTTCAGFSEILFDIRRCLSGGILCDDGDPLTEGDIYDNDCNCIGIPMVVENPCDTPILNITQPSVQTGDYNAVDKVTSTSRVNAGNIVTFTGGNSVELNGGFEVKTGALFYASTAPCVEPLASLPLRRVMPPGVDIPDDPLQGNKKEYLEINGNTAGIIEINFSINRSSPVSLLLEDDQGNLVFPFVNHRPMNGGHYSKILPTSNLKPDIYYVILQTKNNNLRQRIVVLGD
jgi:hypothetical protein